MRDRLLGVCRVVMLLAVVGGTGETGSWAQPARSDIAHAASIAVQASPGAGQLPHRYVAPDAYDAHKQNWDATQDTSGTFYVANTDGVLVYDGHSWRTIPPANRSIVRSVAADGEGRVFVGAQRDVGVLRRDATGRRHYVSLLDHVPEAHRSFTDVWRTEVTGAGTYFQTDRRLFRWRPRADTMQSWAPPEGTEFSQGGTARDTFFVGVEGRGLMAVQDGSLRLVPGGTRFADRSVIFVRPHPQYGLVVGTYDGLFVRDGAAFRRLPTNRPEMIRSAWMQRATVLPDGTIAIATIDFGLLLVGPEGSVRRRLTPRDAPVPGVYFDREGGLWALLDGGLMRYDLGASFTSYGEDVGLEGTVTDVTRHRGRLYVATLQNLYRRRVAADTLAMMPERDINTQSWALLSAGEDLLVGTVRGLNRIGPDGTVRRVFDADHVYGLRRSRVDSARVYAATGRGVRLVRRTEQGWRAGARIPDLDTEARTLAEATDGTLWVGTSFDGVYRVRFGGSLDSTRVDHFGPDDGLPPDRVDPQRWNGEVVFGTSTGLLRFDPEASPPFRPMTAVEMPPLGSNEGVVRIQIEEKRQTWGFTGWGPGRWVRQDTTWRWAPGPLHRLRGRSLSVLYSEDKGRRLWMGTQDGLIRYVPGAARAGPPPPVRIREVRATTPDTLLPAPPADGRPTLPYAQNDVRVAYGTPSLAWPGAIEYQHRVSGWTDGWSDWTDRTTRELPNLNPGTYTVAVRARTAYGDTARAARYAFTVRPPWYRTWWAYGGYGLLAVLLVGGTVRWRTRQLRRRQEALAATVAERTEEIRQQNERLQELDDAKSRFFANVTHEFRTPLTLIKGPVQSVREDLEHGRLETPDADAEQLRIAERNTARLQRLIDQILGLARLDADAYEIAARPTALPEATRRIVRRFVPLAEQAGLTLTVDADEPSAEEHPPVYVDPEAWEHILSNLLSNAVKFTPEGGTVRVSVTEGPDAVELAVHDDGPGIPEAEQDNIFDRFQQADTSATQNQGGKGTGIGLAFAKNLVDVHGGTVRIDSTEGEGTTVIVRLPRGADHLSADQHVDVPASPDEPDAQSEASLPPLDDPSAARPGVASVPVDERPSASDGLPAEPVQGEHDGQSKVVLVVDDNADIRRYVRAVLSSDFAVLEATDGEEGVAVARTHLPDVILADVMMPAVDGHEMTRRLKDDPATAAIPVIMVTARAETTDEVEGLRVGADDYVTKPFDADVLRQRVGGVLTLQQRLRRELEAALEDEDTEPEDSNPGDRPRIERRARAAIREHLTAPDFGVAELADALATSRSTLYRKLTSDAGVTPSALMREVRMNEATRLLRDGERVTQVAYAVGYESLAGFTEAFKNETGTLPSAVVSGR